MNLSRGITFLAVYYRNFVTVFPEYFATSVTMYTAVITAVNFDVYVASVNKNVDLHRACEYELKV